MTIIPLNIITGVITNSKAHIGFDDAGTELVTNVINIAYDSRIVMPRDTRSPESIGNKNTSGFIKQNSNVGRMTITIKYIGCLLIEISNMNKDTSGPV